MQIINLTEQTRLLGQVAPALESLREEVERVRGGEISKPVRELAPIAVRAQELANQCTQQLAVLSTSQYTAMKDGPENLAELAEASAQVSLAATLCTLAIHSRTEVLLYEDADETPETSRQNLRGAVEELDFAATTYRRLTQRLSRRLASTAERREDQQLIDRALAAPGATGTHSTTPTPAPTAVKAACPSPARSALPRGHADDGPLKGRR
ncbi:hypothetical protein SSP35_22_00680 [Streptomyces sp. NBRC 110611]|uniref:hypothetical protein n=1 Tax=Streptomyces sp. NBRC 110611 TaxID=1621259 RepID=UPI000858D415|nr:hypothetical protein [Streptomyces sp. NBRC 110611]GAU70764.1 hypothetical protein SSP35_22_00680 [Streptomyces sp. NBRC 110611]